MNITRVVIRPVEMSKVRAMASITIDDAFVIHGLRVVEGERGLFVAMPSRRLPSGEYRDVAHPINTETREMIEKTVLEEYEKFKEAPSEKPWAKEETAPPAVETETEAEKETEAPATETEEKEEISPPEKEKEEAEPEVSLPEEGKEESSKEAKEEPEEAKEEPSEAEKEEKE